MKLLVNILFICLGCQLINAKTMDDTSKIEAIENKYIKLQDHHYRIANDLCKLKETMKESERIIQTLKSENYEQSVVIDSLRNICNQLEDKLSADNKNICRKIDETNSNVQENQNMLQSRTLWAGMVVLLLLVAIFGVAYRLAKRIKSGSTSIDEVRKAQDALQVAQGKMREESIKLDDKLLELFDRQIANDTKKEGNDKPDHSLVVKLADEIARIETNLSKMDKSVRGYKQLVQAKDRMINNVRANGYEIISLLGQEYNDGMQFQTRFVPDESLPEGKRIITGMIKMQVNYNGKMIQPAEIVVSQNI